MSGQRHGAGGNLLDSHLDELIGWLRALGSRQGAARGPLGFSKQGCHGDPLGPPSGRNAGACAQCFGGAGARIEGREGGAPGPARSARTS